MVEKKVAEEIGKVATMYNTSFNLGIGDNFYFDGVKNEHDKRFQVCLINLISNHDDVKWLCFTM